MDKTKFRPIGVENDKADNSVIAPVESGTTASRAYAIGEHFIRDGAFCTAKTAIAQGEAFTLNTNYTAGDIAGNLQELKTDFLKTYVFNATSSGSRSEDEIFPTPPQFSGYKLVGILGYHELSSFNVYFYNLFITSTGMLDIGWKTRDGSTVNNHNVALILLYVKNQ